MVKLPSNKATTGTKGGGKPSRLLFSIPIVHGLTDMGSISDDVRNVYIEQKGLEAWEESRRVIRQFWQDLERKILALDLDFGQLRLYQDGLPVCGREVEIIRDLVETGGPNYRILLHLMARGAVLEGTEDSELLLREYRLLKAEAAEPGTAAGQKPPDNSVSMATALLEERDRFIARRIDATLQPGETGMLFLGALHRVTEMLPSTIEVRMLGNEL